MLERIFFDIASFGVPSKIQIIPWVLAVIWGIFFLERLGLFYLKAIDVRGDPTTIITANLGHQSLAHITSNSIGAILLLWIYLSFTADPWPGLIIMFLGSSGLYWLVGPSSNNHGRGLSYALFALMGWWLVWASTADETSIIYWGMLAIAAWFTLGQCMPGEQTQGKAWDGHLSGLVFGLGYALYDFGYLAKWIA